MNEDWVDEVLEAATEGEKARGGLAAADNAAIADVLDKYLFDSMILTVGEVEYLAINIDALTDSQLTLIKYILFNDETVT